MSKTIQSTLMTRSINIARCAVSLCIIASCAAPSPSTPQTTSSASVSNPHAVQKVKVKLKAAVIKGSGDLVPVARTKFNFDPVDTVAITKEIEVKNGAGEMPGILDKKYQTVNCQMIGTTNFCSTDFNQYDADTKAWEAKAHVGLQDAIDAARKKAGASVVSVQTDLAGEATVEIQPGKWYVFGSYELLGGQSRINWVSVEFDIKADTEKIELSNDNGSVHNSSR